MAVAAQKTDLAQSLLDGWPTPSGAGWAAAARAEARARLIAMGAPHRRDEYWRFTDPAVLTASSAPDVALRGQTEPPLFDALDKLLIVFVDGVFRSDLSGDLAGEGLEISLLDDAVRADLHWARGLFGVLERAGQHPVPRPLAALNTAVAASGVLIRATGPVSRPVVLRYLHGAAGAQAMLHHLVRVEPGAELTLIEHGAGAARLNTCLEVDVADTGTFHHVRAQGRTQGRVAATHMFARLGRESVFKSFTLTANGALTRNECVIEMTGDDATAHIAGAALGDGAFRHDDTIFVIHGAERCESRQVFKKVLRNGATGIFQGKILVRQGAQKTDGYQISQGLLLDEDSTFLAKPELEIYADDVVCSHGSTCGAVEPTQLFYLTSRGVPRPEAQNMLVLAFVDEAIAEIDNDALADQIRARLASWLGNHGG